MNYKIGDKLRIIANVAGHGFKIGTLVEVTNTFPESEDPHYKAENENGEFWYIGDDEVELVEKEVK